MTSMKRGKGWVFAIALPVLGVVGVSGVRKGVTSSRSYLLLCGITKIVRSVTSIVGLLPILSNERSQETVTKFLKLGKG